MPEHHQNSAAQPVRTGPIRPHDRSLDAATTRLLVERTRVGLWIVLISLGVLWATDVALKPDLVVSWPACPVRYRDTGS